MITSQNSEPGGKEYGAAVAREMISLSLARSKSSDFDFIGAVSERLLLAEKRFAGDGTAADAIATWEDQAVAEIARCVTEFRDRWIISPRPERWTLQ